ncbi:hypothetical protein D3C75_528630 [compost metagenome]
MVMQGLKYGFGDRANSKLKRRAGFYAFGNALGDGTLHWPWLHRPALQGRAIGVQYDVQLVLDQIAFTESPWACLVDLGYDNPGGFQGGQQVFVCKPQAEPSQLIWWCQLQHQHVDSQRTLANQLGEFGVMARQDIQYARLGQCSVVPAPTIRDKFDAVGMFREAGVAVGDAQKGAQMSDATTFAHQRVRQRQRFGIGLPPHHGLSGPDDAAEVERVFVGENFSHGHFSVGESVAPGV